MTPTIRRRLSGWLASVALVAAVTVVIKLLHPHGPARGLAVIYILVVLWAAVRWGPAFAFVASLLSAGAFAYFSLSPQYAFGLPDLADVESFAAFLATAIMASLLAVGYVGRLGKRAGWPKSRQPCDGSRRWSRKACHRSRSSRISPTRYDGCWAPRSPCCPP